MANFSEEMIQKVWEKGKPSSDSANWRKDECDAWISRKAYGNRQSDYGWEIDHISPGGADTLSNLRPLHWKNNVAKSDGRLTCVVTSRGDKNIPK
jgi:hypothetical protein